MIAPGEREYPSHDIRCKTPEGNLRLGLTFIGILRKISPLWNPNRGKTRPLGPSRFTERTWARPPAAAPRAISRASERPPPTPRPESCSARPTTPTARHPRSAHARLPHAPSAATSLRSRPASIAHAPATTIAASPDQAPGTPKASAPPPPPLPHPRSPHHQRLNTPASTSTPRPTRPILSPHQLPAVARGAAGRPAATPLKRRRPNRPQQACENDPPKRFFVCDHCPRLDRSTTLLPPDHNSPALHPQLPTTPRASPSPDTLVTPRLSLSASPCGTRRESELGNYIPQDHGILFTPSPVTPVSPRVASIFIFPDPGPSGLPAPSRQQSFQALIAQQSTRRRARRASSVSRSSA
jgi:hypothetical protein